jgi:hypothetical protein
MNTSTSVRQCKPLNAYGSSSSIETRKQSFDMPGSSDDTAVASAVSHKQCLPGLLGALAYVWLVTHSAVAFATVQPNVLVIIAGLLLE